jgi:predicted nucleic acid-binding protein
VILLDTNVICELTRPEPSPDVLAWVDSVHGPDVATTAITAAELLYGIARLPGGRRKDQLREAIEHLLDVDFAGRVHPFDREAASYYAGIVAGREAGGRPIAPTDAQVAGICRSRDAVLATRNIRDFHGTGVRLINPWEALGRPDSSAGE